MQQQEAPGAIGRLGHPRFKTRLPDHRRLLVPGNPGNRDRPAQHPGRPEHPGTVAHLRQHRGRHPKQRQHRRVPGAGTDVVQHRPAGIGGIRPVHPPLGQPPQQPGIDSPERQPPGLGIRPRARHIIQDPGDLGGAEIRVQQQPGAGRHRRLMPRRAQAGTHRRRPPVLPDDRPMHRPPGHAVPHQRRLALVGDPDPRHIGGRRPCQRHRLAQHRQRVGEQILGLMLDPAAIRKMLRQLPPCRRHRRQARRAKGNAPRRSGALVEGEDQVLGHRFPQRKQGRPSFCGQKEAKKL